MIYGYETAGNSNYLVATFEEGKELINYQLQMLVNNDIKNVISAAKKQKNDDIQIFYNITSKITLEQATEQNKITKDGVISIISGALAVLADLEEYQLVSSGIIFDADKIYVKPGHFEPNFIYVPNTTEDTGIQSLKNLLLGFIMGSKIEVSNDNFVQVLLETLNKPEFSAGVLKKMCERYKGGNRAVLQNRAETKQEVNAPQPPKPQTAPSFQEEKPVQAYSAEKAPNKPPMQKQPEVQKQTEEKKKENSSKKVLFFILQIVLFAAVGALFANGFLNDEAGNINFQYLAGILIAVFGIDFVVYREMFKNNKEKAEKKEKEPKAKAAKKPSVAVPGKDLSVVPKPVSSIPKKPLEISQKEENIKKPTFEAKAVPKKAENKIPIPTAVSSIPQAKAYDPLSEFENEDTVVIENNISSGAYLEFFENGIANKINLNKEQIVVGKLRSQCDFALNNRKISKMHAEFISRGGQFYVKDYNSTNGTYINGSNQRIASNVEYQIFNGDRITLADVDMTFRC